MTNKISWLGTLASITGSFSVALATFQIGYVLFTVGSVSWLWVAYCRRDKSLAVLNGTFLVANIVGLVNYF